MHFTCRAPLGHRRALAIALPALVALGCAATVSQARSRTPAPKWHTFMPAEAMGARAFVKAHREWDGRGVVVAVLDTGVDPRATGLSKTSTGAVKVIEARDFSGQGDVALAPAEALEGPGGHLRNHLAELSGVETLKPPPNDGRWLLGAFSETRVGPSKLRDVNHDGRKDGKLALLVWRVGNGDSGLRIAMDLDGDGSIAGETIVQPYHVRQQLLVPKARKASRDVAKLSFAVEVDPSEHRASLHFTDGSHGTHVAGIICGHDTFGKAGWHGVAPGAQVLSLKIGHNARSGGATTTGSFKKALQFAGRWSSRKGVPVVVNASYGIGSAIEARSDIDAFVDRLVQRHPLLTISLSAGNAGPGLSTVGTPAAAHLALAVGAMVPAAAVPDLYGGKVKGDRMFFFSSRGGELNKPEVVAPGVAAASVPVWDGREIKNGTSMAAPHVAGAMALLWSGLRATGAKGAHSGVVRRALTGSARPLAGYDRLDQGSGLIDVNAAWKLAGQLLSGDEARTVLGYEIGSDAPHPSGKRMPASLLRSGVFTGDGTFKVDIRVKALLPRTMSAEERAAWSATYKLESEASWLRVDRSQLLLRGENVKHFGLAFEPKRLTKPGVYTARVVARAGDGVAFESWQTVVIPRRFDSAAARTATWAKIRLQPGQVWRQFVQVPAGARHAAFHVRPAKGAFARVAVSVFDPDGHHSKVRPRGVSSKRGGEAAWQMSGERLRPGTWELTISASIRSTQPSVVNANLAFSGAKVSDVGVLKAKAGGLAKASLTVTNLYEAPFTGSARGQVDRLVRRGSDEVEGDSHSQSVTLGPGFRAARVDVELSPADYNRTTDIAVMVRDSSGRTIASTAMSQPHGHISWRHSGGETTYKVVVEAGMTHRRERKKWRLKWQRHLLLTSPVGLKVKPAGGGRLLAYPGVPLKLKVSASGPLPHAPKGFAHQGKVELFHADGRRRWLEIPISGAKAKKPAKAKADRKPKKKADKMAKAAK